MSVLLDNRYSKMHDTDKLRRGIVMAHILLPTSNTHSPFPRHSRFQFNRSHMENYCPGKVPHPARMVRETQKKSPLRDIPERSISYPYVTTPTRFWTIRLFHTFVSHLQSPKHADPSPNKVSCAPAVVKQNGMAMIKVFKLYFCSMDSSLFWGKRPS